MPPASPQKPAVAVKDIATADLMARAEYLAGVYTRLRQQVATYSSNNGLGFEREYESFADVGTAQSSKASAHPKNVHLNRFRNISAYDHSRVVLEEQPTDYINANWIPGNKRRHAYIASQGPVPDSFAHFWYMVWQSKVRMQNENDCSRSVLCFGSQIFPKTFILLFLLELKFPSRISLGQVPDIRQLYQCM